MDDDGMDDIGAIATGLVLAVLIVGGFLYQWNVGEHFDVSLSCGPDYSSPCK